MFEKFLDTHTSHALATSMAPNPAAAPAGASAPSEARVLAASPPSETWSTVSRPGRCPSLSRRTAHPSMHAVVDAAWVHKFSLT